jgi:hypothetical protein
LAAFHAGLEGIQKALLDGLARVPAAPVSAATATPPTVPAMDWTPMVQGLESLRTAILERPPVALPVPPAAPLPVPPAVERVAGEPRDSLLAEKLSEGLAALGEDLTRAVSVTHSSTLAERVDSLSHELEMIHSTLATLKDLAGQQRDHLRGAQELLATRARQGTVEFELTEDMLKNERAFLERFHEVLAKTERAATPAPVSGAGSNPETLPPRIEPSP